MLKKTPFTKKHVFNIAAVSLKKIDAALRARTPVWFILFKL